MKTKNFYQADSAAKEQGEESRRRWRVCSKTDLWVKTDKDRIDLDLKINMTQKGLRNVPNFEDDFFVILFVLWIIL